MPSLGEQLLHAVRVDEWEWKFNVWLYLLFLIHFVILALIIAF